MQHALSEYASLARDGYGSLWTENAETEDALVDNVYEKLAVAQKESHDNKEIFQVVEAIEYCGKVSPNSPNGCEHCSYCQRTERTSCSNHYLPLAAGIIRTLLSENERLMAEDAKTEKGLKKLSETFAEIESEGSKMIHNQGELCGIISGLKELLKDAQEERDSVINKGFVITKANGSAVDLKALSKEHGAHISFALTGEGDLIIFGEDGKVAWLDRGDYHIEPKRSI